MQDKWGLNKDNSHNNRMRHVDNAMNTSAISQSLCGFSSLIHHSMTVQRWHTGPLKSPRKPSTNTYLKDALNGLFGFFRGLFRAVFAI